MSATEGDTRAEEIPPEEQHMGVTRLARRVFVWFIITFALARSVGILMSLGRLHDFYLRFGQTHVHHLNYGIFILACSSSAPTKQVSPARRSSTAWVWR